MYGGLNFHKISSFSSNKKTQFDLERIFKIEANEKKNYLICSIRVLKRGATTLSIMTLSNDSQHEETQHNHAQHYDTQHTDIMTLSKMTLSIMKLNVLTLSILT